MSSTPYLESLQRLRTLLIRDWIGLDMLDYVELEKNVATCEAKTYCTCQIKRCGYTRGTLHDGRTDELRSLLTTQIPESVQIFSQSSESFNPTSNT